MARAVYQSNKDIDEDLLLGYMFFYNLGDIKISETDLYNLFVKNGVSASYIRRINPVDAFRRATSKSKETIFISYQGESRKAKIEIDEVKCDTDAVIRAIGRKVIDEKKEDLSYEQVGKLIYNRATNVVDKFPPNYPHRVAGEFNYDKVLDEMIDLYEEWSQYHTKDTIRNQVNYILKDMFPINLLPTGLAKFIPKNQKNMLYALQGLIRDLSNFGSGNLFEIIPIIDTVEQRETVDRAANREIKEELSIFMDELKDIIKSKQALSSRTAVTYIDKFKELKGKAQAYENLLDTYMETLNVQITKALDFIEDNRED